MLGIPFFSWLTTAIQRSISQEQVAIDIQQALIAVNSNWEPWLEEQKSNAHKQKAQET